MHEFARTLPGHRLLRTRKAEKQTPVPVQRELTTDKKERDFPQNSGKNGVE